MGHSSAAMAAQYTGEIPLETNPQRIFLEVANETVVLENMENESAA
jgi:hypothetical protein